MFSVFFNLELVLKLVRLSSFNDAHRPNIHRMVVTSFVFRYSMFSIAPKYTKL